VTFFFVALVFVSPSRMSLPAWLTPAAAFTLAVILVFLFAGVTNWAFGQVFGDRLTLLDPLPCPLATASSTRLWHGVRGSVGKHPFADIFAHSGRAACLS
jgi:hypothetical protein